MLCPFDPEASSLMYFVYSSDVQRDMEDALNRLVPETVQYRHDAEGSDDMPAHVRRDAE